MMDQQERKNKVYKAAERIVKNLDSMTPHDKRVYVGKLINMLDDMHLIALDFAIEMTPEQKGTNNAQ